MERLKEGGGGGNGRKDLFLASCWCCFTLQTHKNDVFNGKVIRWTATFGNLCVELERPQSRLKSSKQEQSYDELFLAYSRIFGAVHLLSFLNFQKKNLMGGHQKQNQLIMDSKLRSGIRRTTQIYTCCRSMLIELERGLPYQAPHIRPQHTI